MFPEIFRDDVFRIETRRLWLRWPTARDEAAIQRFAADSELADMTAAIPHPYPEGGACSYIYQARVGNAQGSALTFALAPVARPHEAIGMIDLRPEAGATVLGYWLGRPFWDRGLMSEAVESFVRTAFQLSDLARIDSYVRTDNWRSRRVLEGCGFVQTGERAMPFPARGRAMPCATYTRPRGKTAPRPDPQDRRIGRE